MSRAPTDEIDWDRGMVPAPRNDDAEAQRIELALVAAALDRWADAIRAGCEPHLSVIGLRDMAGVVRACLRTTVVRAEAAEAARDRLSVQYTNACRLLEREISAREHIVLRGIEVQAENDQLRSAIDTACRAFGAPGDWGYGTREGDAVMELHRLRAALPTTRQSEETPCP